MLTNHITTAMSDPVLNTVMPIPERVLRPESRVNDLGHDTSRYKSDASHFRSPWLDHAIPSGGPVYTQIIVRTIVSVLAVYGLYSLIF